jgi:glycosyltransferase involved in cell wall biosynthesis
MESRSGATLFLPVLNELGGLRAIMPQVPHELFSQILVVDGNSTDGSADWARAQGYDVYVQRVPGIRNAYIEAWPLIRGKTVVTFSPDGNCEACDLKALLSRMDEGYDMVIASRYRDDARSEDDDWITAAGNWMFTRLINSLHGGSYTDAMTIYRAYRTSLFGELGLDRDDSYWQERLFLTTAGIEPLLSIRAARAGLRVAEIPSDEPARLHGSRKLQIVRWGGTYMTQVFTELFQRKVLARKGLG